MDTFAAPPASSDSNWQPLKSYEHTLKGVEPHHFTWHNPAGTYLATRHICLHDGFGWFFYSNNGDFIEKNLEAFRFFIPAQPPDKMVDGQFEVSSDTLSIHYQHYEKVGDQDGIREYPALAGQCNVMINPETRIIQGSWSANFNSSRMPWANGHFKFGVLSPDT
ncbi:MAG: hypothetical protein PW845_23990 [Pseudomonas sp.]|nr:hypothetical protein [Pseudomonas sp.]